MTASKATTKLGTGGVAPDFDPEKTTVYDPIPNPDDPSTMQELKVLTPEEEEARDLETEARILKAKWSTRAKVTFALLAVLFIAGIVILAVMNSPGETITVTKTETKYVKEPAQPAPIAKHEGRRATAKVVTVSTVDFTSCKGFSSIKLSNGNTRLIGTDCAPIAAPAAEATPVAAPPVPPAASPAPAPTAPTAEGNLTEEQQKAAAVVADVSAAALEEIHTSSETPEGAIEATDLQSATTTTPSTK